MSIVKSLFLFLVLILSSNQALSLSCGSSLRTADLSPATNCITGLGNPSISAINALFDTPPSWQRVSSVEDNTSGGSDGWFGVSLDPNSNWGQSNVSGEWSLDSAFWDAYNEGVISMRVGNGGGDPDFFAWKLSDGASTGSFSYERLAGGGGGLSNLKLWGRVTEVIRIEEPANIALFIIGLFGLFASRRFSQTHP